MTAVITLECDQEHGTHSMCATRTSFKTTDAETAREVAGQLGWRTYANGKDYCPGCSGSGPRGSGRRRR